MSETDETKQVVIDTGLVAATIPDAVAKVAEVDPTPTQAKPARQFAPTRFPKLPVLTDAELKKLTPQGRTSYLAAKKHEDDWGHLPPQISSKLVGTSAEVVNMNYGANAVELIAKRRGTDPVHFAAAKAYFKWPMHAQMSEDAYDAAVEEVLSHRHGY